MIERIVRFALANPAAIGVLTVCIIALGIVSFHRLDIEAYPNPVPPLVEVIAQPQGLSAEDVERYITIPIEIGLAGMPGLDHIRSQSHFGLTDVKCYFKWGIEYTDARQEVINRLQFFTLPNGLVAQISPWNAIGEIFRYVVKGKDYSLLELKTAQDWILERQFKQVPGVIDVVSFGGDTKEFHIDLDPNKLIAFNVSVPQVMNAIASSNSNVGANYLEIGAQSYNVRGIGLFNET